MTPTGIVHQDVFQVGAHLPGDAIGRAALRHGAEVIGEGDGTVREIPGSLYMSGLSGLAQVPGCSSQEPVLA